MKIDGINEVMDQVEDFKKTLNTTTNYKARIDRANIVMMVADKELEIGEINEKQYADILDQVCEMVGFHITEFKK